MTENNHAALYVSDDYKYSEVRDHLCLRVVNGEHNDRALKNLPHVRMEDLAAVFLYMSAPCGDMRRRGEHWIGPDEMSCYGRRPNAGAGGTEGPAQEDSAGTERGACESVRCGSPEGEAPVERLICWQDVHRWGVSVEDLYRDAAASSGRMHPAFFTPMRQILGLPSEPEPGEIPMYVLSCIDARFGAAVLMYPDVVPRIAERLGDDIYIIPSSVHELLILRARDVSDPQSLIDMIHEVNETEVAPGEVLSDSLYIYRRSGGIGRLT